MFIVPCKCIGDPQCTNVCSM